MPQHSGTGQPHVADGAVASQTHALARTLGRDLSNPVCDARGLVLVTTVTLSVGCASTISCTRSDTSAVAETGQTTKG